MIEFIVFFLAVSILLYCILAGADFGAGILEFFVRNQKAEHRELVTKAMGPVWEANHVWLILVIVILFNGFPAAFSQLSITYHIPLTLLLIGIVLRGCAFTFRHYDAVQDASQEIYSKLFVASSFLTPVMFGMIIGALLLGRINPDASTFYEGFIAPWFNFFSFSTGIFVLTIFAFLAAVFLVGETTSPTIKAYYVKAAKIASIVMILAGGMVFLAAGVDRLNLIEEFISYPFSLSCMALATFFELLLLISLNKPGIWRPRVIAGGMISMILGAWFWFTFPVILQGKNGHNWTFYNTAAPDITLYFLAAALLVGAILIFPSLYVLFRVFKAK